jgi:hypothetical protein
MVGTGPPRGVFPLLLAWVARLALDANAHVLRLRHPRTTASWSTIVTESLN